MSMRIVIDIYLELLDLQFSACQLNNNGRLVG